MEKCAATFTANARANSKPPEDEAPRVGHRKVGLNSAETTLSQIFNPELIRARTSLMPVKNSTFIFNTSTVEQIKFTS
ncbi:MAG: hypothetical protein CMD99_06950 [Gammaproteobacteria bacterium]|nr:hypothetical protein [Gammaproteobacteria bacterium]